MKKLGLFFAALFAVVLLNAQTPTIFFSENFDNAGTADTNYAPLNLPGWIIDTVDLGYTGYRIWSYYVDVTGVAHISAYGMDADSVQAWLITPAITLNATGNPLKLSVKLKFRYPVSDPLTKQFKIMVTTDNIDESNYLNANWTVLKDTFPASDWDFHTFDIDLSSYENQTIHIAFVYYGNNTDYTTTVRIDNVVVQDEPPVPLLQSVYTYDDTTIIAEFDKNISDYTVGDFELNDGVGTTIKDMQLIDTLHVKLITNDPMTVDAQQDTLTFTPSMTSATFFAGVLPLAYLNPANADFVGFGANVTVRGYVVAIKYGSSGPLSFVLNDGQGEYHGIEVWGSSSAADRSVGDSVILNANLAAYYDYPELQSARDVRLLGLVDVSTLQPAVVDDQSIFSINSTDPTQPPMNYIATLVKLNKVSQAAYTSKSFNSYWTVTDENGNQYYVDDRFYHDDVVNFDQLLDGSKTYNIIGLLAYTYGHYTINPRNSSDVSEFVASVDKVTGVSVYPNPAENNLYVTGQKISRYEIINTAGQILKYQNVNTDNLNVNVSDLQPGIYMIRVFTDRGVGTLQFIKR